MNQMPMHILRRIAECIPPPSDYETLRSFILSIDAQYWNFKEMESNCKKAAGSNATVRGRFRDETGTGSELDQS